MSMLWLPTAAPSVAPGTYYIDTANPLSEGLLLATLPGTKTNFAAAANDPLRVGAFRSQTTVNADGESMNMTGRANNIDHNDTVNGKAGLWFGGVGTSSRPGPMFAGLTDYSLLVHVVNAGSIDPSSGGSDGDQDDGRIGGGNAAYCERGDGDNGYSIFKLEFGNLNFATNWIFTFRNTAGNLVQQTVRCDGAGQAANGTAEMVASISVQGSVGILRCYTPNGGTSGVNPVDGESTATIPTNRSFNSGIFRAVGADEWDNRSVWNGTIKSVHGWNRPMSAQAWESLKRNPRQLIKKS